MEAILFVLSTGCPWKALDATGLYPASTAHDRFQEWVKAGVVHRRSPWKSRESVEMATLEWVAWYYHKRLMLPLEYIPPAEAEAKYYRQLASQAARAA